MLEGSEGAGSGRFLSTPEGKSLTALNEALNALLASVDGADAAPTRQAVSMFNDVNAALAQQVARWQELKTKDAPALNLSLKQSGLAPINLELADTKLEGHWVETEKVAGED